MLRDAPADAVPLGDLLADADYGRLWALRQWCREVGMRWGSGSPDAKGLGCRGNGITPTTAAEYAACVPAKNYGGFVGAEANGQTLAPASRPSGRSSPERPDESSEWLVRGGGMADPRRPPDQKTRAGAKGEKGGGEGKEEGGGGGGEGGGGGGGGRGRTGRGTVC